MSGPEKFAPKMLRFDRGTLVLTSPPPSRVAHLLKRDERAGTWRCDALHFSHVSEALREVSPAYTVGGQNLPRIHWPTVSLTDLRPDQSEAVEAWMKTWGTPQERPALTADLMCRHGLHCSP